MVIGYIDIVVILGYLVANILCGQEPAIGPSLHPVLYLDHSMPPGPDTKLRSDSTQLVAPFVESALWGIYLISVVRAAQALWAPPSEPKRYITSKRVFVVVALSFVFITLDLVLGILHILQAYIYGMRSGNSTSVIFGQDWVNTMRVACVGLQTLTADGFLVYQCWIVYSRSFKVVILPVVLWLGSSVCFFMGMYANIELDLGHGIFISNWTYPLRTSFWTASIGLNVYATGMIISRIRRVATESTPEDFPLYPARPKTRLQNVVRILIDSGMLFTATSVIMFITIIVNSNFFNIMAAAEMPISAMAFNLILIRTKNSSQQVSLIQRTSHGIVFASASNCNRSKDNHLSSITLQLSDSAKPEVVANDPTGACKAV